MKIRRLLLTVFVVAATLVGCGTPDIDTDAKEIKFGEATTRAEVDSADDILEFKVFAEMNLGADGTAEASQWIPILENERVYRTSTSSPFIYDHTRYWVENRKFNFFAVYPYDTAVTVNEGAASFSVAETPSETDWLIARNATDTSESYDSMVQLQFKHILTSVGLRIWRDNGKHQNDQMRIKKVTLANMRKAGTVTSGMRDESLVWSYTADKLTMEHSNTNLSDTDNIGAAQIGDDGKLTTGGNAANPFGTMFLIPQTLNNVTLTIVYDLKMINAKDWTEKTLEAVLPPITWEIGKSYTYNIILSSVTNITIYYIQTTVDPWGTPQVGGTVIIK